MDIPFYRYHFYSFFFLLKLLFFLFLVRQHLFVKYIYIYKITVVVKLGTSNLCLSSQNALYFYLKISLFLSRFKFFYLFIYFSSIFILKYYQMSSYWHQVIKKRRKYSYRCNMTLLRLVYFENLCMECKEYDLYWIIC